MTSTTSEPLLGLMLPPTLVLKSKGDHHIGYVRQTKGGLQSIRSKGTPTPKAPKKEKRVIDPVEQKRRLKLFKGKVFTADKLPKDMNITQALGIKFDKPLPNYDRGIKPKDVTIDLTGDIDSHIVLRWAYPDTPEGERRYTPEGRKRSHAHKWKRVKKLDSGDKIGKAMKAAKDIFSDPSRGDEDRDIAAMMLMMGVGGIRHGEQEHFDARGTRGAATLLKKDVVKIQGDTVFLKFQGKGKTVRKREKGKVVEEKKLDASYPAQIKDASLAKYVKQCLKRKGLPSKRGEMLWATKAYKLKHKEYGLKLVGLNGHIFHDLRSYFANSRAAEYLAKVVIPKEVLADPNTARPALKKAAIEVFKKIGDLMNDDYETIRAAYVDKNVIKAWLATLGASEYEDHVVKALSPAAKKIWDHAMKLSYPEEDLPFTPDPDEDEDDYGPFDDGSVEKSLLTEHPHRQKDYAHISSVRDGQGVRGTKHKFKDNFTSEAWKAQITLILREHAIREIGGAVAAGDEAVGEWLTARGLRFPDAEDIVTRRTITTWLQLYAPTAFALGLHLVGPDGETLASPGELARFERALTFDLAKAGKKGMFSRKMRRVGKGQGRIYTPWLKKKFRDISPGKAQKAVERYHREGHPEAVYIPPGTVFRQEAGRVVFYIPTEREDVAGRVKAATSKARREVAASQTHDVLAIPVGSSMAEARFAKKQEAAQLREEKIGHTVAGLVGFYREHPGIYTDPVKELMSGLSAWTKPVHVMETPEIYKKQCADILSNLRKWVITKDRDGTVIDKHRLLEGEARKEAHRVLEILRPSGTTTGTVAPPAMRYQKYLRELPDIGVDATIDPMNYMLSLGWPLKASKKSPPRTVNLKVGGVNTIRRVPASKLNRFTKAHLSALHYTFKGVIDAVTRYYANRYGITNADDKQSMRARLEDVLVSEARGWTQAVFGKPSPDLTFRGHVRRVLDNAARQWCKRKLKGDAREQFIADESELPMPVRGEGYVLPGTASIESAEQGTVRRLYEPVVHKVLDRVLGPFSAAVVRSRLEMLGEKESEHENLPIKVERPVYNQSTKKFATEETPLQAKGYKSWKYVLNDLLEEIPKMPLEEGTKAAYVNMLRQWKNRNKADLLKKYFHLALSTLKSPLVGMTYEERAAIAAWAGEHTARLQGLRISGEDGSGFSRLITKPKDVTPKELAAKEQKYAEFRKRKGKTKKERAKRRAAGIELHHEVQKIRTAYQLAHPKRELPTTIARPMEHGLPEYGLGKLKGADITEFWRNHHRLASDLGIKGRNVLTPSHDFVTGEKHVVQTHVFDFETPRVIAGLEAAAGTAVVHQRKMADLYYQVHKDMSTLATPSIKTLLKQLENHSRQIQSVVDKNQARMGKIHAAVEKHPEKAARYQEAVQSLEDANKKSLAALRYYSGTIGGRKYKLPLGIDSLLKVGSEILASRRAPSTIKSLVIPTVGSALDGLIDELTLWELSGN